MTGARELGGLGRETKEVSMAGTRSHIREVEEREESKELGPQEERLRKRLGKKEKIDHRYQS